MTNHQKQNAAIKPWLRALHANGGSMLIGAHEESPRGLYWLGSLWAEQRGLIVKHGTVDIISYEPRRYAYTLTTKGKRAASRLAH